MHTRFTPKTHSTRLLLAAVILSLLAVGLMAVVLVACGEESTDTTEATTATTAPASTESTAPATTEATTATTAPATTETTAAAAMNPWDEVTTGETVDLAGLVERLKEPPTWEGPTSSPPIAEGKHVVSIPCGMAFEGCARASDAFVEAATFMGWETTVIDPAGDPAKMQAAMKQALTLGADGVYAAALTNDQVGNVLPELREAGIVCITDADSYPATPDTWSANVLERAPEMSAACAAWIGANKPDAKILMITDHEFYQALEASQIFTELLPVYCPGCEIVEQFDFSIVDLTTTMPARAKASLLAHPEIDMVYPLYDAAGVPVISAIQQAGLSDKVGVITWEGNLQNLNYLADGEVQVADVAKSREWLAYVAADQMNRVFNGEPIFEPMHEYWPLRLFDSTNISDADLTKNWEGQPADFRAEYKKIWTAGEG